MPKIEHRNIHAYLRCDFRVGGCFGSPCRPHYASCSSVCPSVSYTGRAPINSKTKKNVEKPKFVLMLNRGLNFSSKVKVKVAGGQKLHEYDAYLA